MELTRRDALAALAAAGISVSAGCLGQEGDEDVPEETVSGLLDVAEVVYPEEVEVTEEFVETYTLGRVQDREEYLSGVTRALEELDGASRELRDEGFESLSVEERDSLLRDIGADTAEPYSERGGSLAGTVRYYVINELQYALYTSPVGGRLVGIENPIGHPGGTETYTRRTPE